MTTLNIEHLDEQLKQQLHIEATKHGWSIEEEIQQILRNHLLPSIQTGFGTRLQQRFAHDNVDFPLPVRNVARYATFNGNEK